MPVPLFVSSHERYKDEIAARFRDVLDGGRYVLGPEVAEFEREFAAYLDVPFCVGVGNGTDALTIALRAMGVDAGDEVVVPSFTFYATAEAVASFGAVPVFCDIEPDTFMVSPESVERALTSRTKAVVAVHLFGNVAPVPEIEALGVPVLEDAAQAVGAALDGRRAGALGTAATFSFFPSKNLPCIGDGGAVATRDAEVAERARRLRFHGSEDKVTFVDVGYNSRLDELQAAALRVLLPHLDAWNEVRRTAAAAYAEHGLGAFVALPRVPDGASHVYHLYVARHDRPDELARELGEREIAARGYYRTPVHRQPAMREFAPPDDELPGTMEAARTNLALPIGSDMREEQVAEVVAATREALAGAGRLSEA
jgi:dTDP-3-amino-3,4,6-trideoxy-alpha-D-glucose transaminase